MGQVSDLLNLSVPKMSIHMSQHVDRIFARAEGVAIGGKPIVKTIDDRPQHGHGEELR